MSVTDKLSDPKVKQAKPKDKTYKLSDGGGMYLEVAPSGGKWWRLKYRFDGKEKRLSLGVYPDVPLARAREKRNEARKLLADGIDPGVERKAEKAAKQDRAKNNFEAVAREWHEKRLRGGVNGKAISPGHARQIINTLEREIFPKIGKMPVAEILAPELLAALRPIEARGALEIASKVRVWCGMVFRYAIASGYAKYNPAPDLRGALATPVTKHYAAFDRDGMADFMRRLDDYDGHIKTKLALRFLAMTFVRTGEMRGAEWSEFDLEGATWRIPGERMKMGMPHIVPLSRQSIEVLKELHALTGEGRLAFPGQNSQEKPMSENTVLYALYRMGYHGRATGHGFRATASTLLNEMGWRPDVIERQLAHSEKSKVRAAYHRSEYLAERREMMQAWADFLEALAKGAKVIPLHRTA